MEERTNIFHWDQLCHPYHHLYLHLLQSFQPRAILSNQSPSRLPTSLSQSYHLSPSLLHHPHFSLSELQTGRHPPSAARLIPPCNLQITFPSPANHLHSSSIKNLHHQWSPKNIIQLPWQPINAWCNLHRSYRHPISISLCLFSLSPYLDLTGILGCVKFKKAETPASARAHQAPVLEAKLLASFSSSSPRVLLSISKIPHEDWELPGCGVVMMELQLPVESPRLVTYWYLACKFS